MTFPSFLPPILVRALSNLHSEKLLITLQQFVPNLDHQLKRDTGFLHRDHRLVKRDIAASTRDYRAGNTRPAEALLAELRVAERRGKAAPRRGKARARA